MKKFLSGLLCMCLMIFATACGGNNGGNGNVTYAAGGTVMNSDTGFETAALTEWKKVDEYNLSTATVPVWNTKNVYNETVTFIGRADAQATLLYVPTKIHKVYDYYLGKEYQEGKDFTVEGNKIKLTRETSINFWQVSDYYSNTPDPLGLGASLPIEYNGSTFYLPYSEVYPNTHQICVSYEHDGLWKGAVPISQSEKLPKTLSRLKEGGVLNVAVVGDSISVGGGSSEHLKDHFQISVLGYNPYVKPMPSYVNLVNQYLNAKFVNATVNFENVSVGGKDSSWGSLEGVQNVKQTPDLAIIAFGMNDAGRTLSSYKYNIQDIMNKILQRNPNCEFVLVSTMIPNPNVTGWTGNIPEFEGELLSLAADYKGVAVAPMTTMSQSVYSLGKRFVDVNSNNINHPNDFMHRIYAQTILKVMLGDDYTLL